MDKIEHPEIPKGDYCYTIVGYKESDHKDDEACKKLAEIFGVTDQTDFPRMITKPCPHWGKDDTRPEHESGFCKLTGLNDWTDETLLWDQVKECGINREW